jgi:hypothetical protein
MVGVGYGDMVRAAISTARSYSDDSLPREDGFADAGRTSSVINTPIST